MNLIVDSNGTTARETILARKLADEFQRAAEQAIRIRTGSGPTPGPGAGPGQRQRPPGASGGNPPVPPTPPAPIGESAVDAARRRYNETTGARGTGASATSDFARQAQGLGGLVHVYATFAANIFAVGAAFRALSSAADTSNMIKGLDQLGASSGRNLGSLAKQLVATSDGAISLKEAIMATAQATAGGMADKDLLRLTEVAKKASQALGRDMPDALSRLTRGIVKIEPELLDELGIMVKVDRASIEYARTLGKTAASLSDLEKRQGFANAVIEQGEKKFNSIQMSANPYSKIIASTANLAQSTLELINKGLGPVVRLLAENPAALGLAIAGIAGMLLRQAIPALGQWRAGLVATALQARTTASSIHAAYREFQTQQLSRNQPGLQQHLAAQEAAVAASAQRMQNLVSTSGARMPREIQAIMAKTASTITQADNARLAQQEQVFRNRARMAAETAADIGRTPASAASYRAVETRFLNQANAVRTFTTSLGEARTAEAALAADRLRIQEELNRRQGVLSLANQKRIQLERAERRAIRAEILSNVGQNVQSIGFGGAMKQLSTDAAKARNDMIMTGRHIGLAQQATNNLAYGGTLVRGAFMGATSAVSGLMGAFMPWVMLIGIAVVAAKALNSALSSNAKETAKLEEAYGSLSSSADVVAATLDKINEKADLDKFSIESIQARATSFGNISDSLKQVAKDTTKATEAAGFWDKMWDHAFSDFGYDIKTLSLEKAVMATVKSFDALDSSVKVDAIRNLKNELGTEDLSKTGIVAAISKLSDADKEVALQRIADSVGEINKQVAKEAGSLTTYKSLLSEVSKNAASLSVSASSLDTMGKFGVSISNAAIGMSEKIGDANGSLLELKTMLEDVGSFSFLPPDTIKQLTDASEGVKKLSIQMVSVTKARDNYSKFLDKALAERDKRTGTQDFAGTGPTKEQESAVTAAKEGVAIFDDQLLVLNKRAEVYMQLFETTQKAAYETGSRILTESLKNSAEMASISVAKSILSGLTGPGATAITTSIRLKEISIQERAVDTQLKLIQATKDASAALERNTNMEKLKSLKSDLELNTATMQSPDFAKLDVAGQARVMQTRLDTLRAKDATQRSLDDNEAIETITKKIRALKSTAQMGAWQEQVTKAPTVGIKSALSAEQVATAPLIAEKDKIEAERRIALANDLLVKLKEQNEVLVKGIEFKTIMANLELQSINYAMGLSQVYSSSLQNDRLVTENKQKQLELDKQALAYKLEIDSLAAKSRVTGYSTATLKDQADVENARKVAEIKETNRQKEITSINDIAARKLAEAERVQAFADKDYANNQLISKAKIDSAQSLFNMQQSLGQVSEEYAIKETANLALQNAQAERAVALKGAQVAFDQEQARLNSGLDAQKLAAPGKSEEIEKTRTIELARQVASYNLQTSAIEASSAAKVLDIGYIKEANTELNKQAKLLKTMDSVAEALSKAFGKVGTSIGTIGKTMMASAKTLVDIEKKKQNDLSSLAKDGPPDPKEQAKLEKKYALESASVQMGAAADIAGAVADSFDQQSGAAKAFHTIEKVFHVAKLAMDVEGVISSIAAAGVEATLAASVATAWIPAVWARAFGEGGPYLGWALGAAAVAMIFAGGGGKGGGGSGPSSEDKQKVQGTGQRYNSQGKLEDTGYGILGDSSAKSESIAKSIELIAQYSFEELEYNNKMLSALERIADSITGVSKGLVLTTGLLSGTAFGTSEGAKNKFGGSIFGGNRTTSITGSGISIGGTFGGIGSGAGSATQYEDVKNTKSGGWFSSDKEWMTRYTTELGASVKTALQKSFNAVGEGMVEVGSALGLDAKSLAATINAIPVNLAIETRGLKGKELEEAVSAVLSAEMDRVASITLGLVEPFQKVGEGMLETAVRVANTSRVIDLQLKSVGTTFGAIGLGSLNARMALVDLAGGLEQFVSNSNYFKDNFLSEAEKLAPVQKAVTDELNRLGISSVNTRDKFKELVLAQDLSSASGQAMYTSLMALEKGFATVYEASEVVTSSVKELASSSLDQLIKVMDLLGNKSGALLRTREKELKEMDKRLHPMQLWIYALEDEATARDALKTAYDSESTARQASIDSLKTSQVTIRDFISSLTMGALSPLTPAQKYEQAKSDLAGITAVLNDSATLKEDRDSAIGKLPGAVTSLLDTSKIFNASSSAYQQDYTTSQALLKGTYDSISTQLTTEEKSLAELKTQVSLLGVISDNVVSVSTAIQDLVGAMSTTEKLKVPGTGAESVPTSQIPGFNTNMGAQLPLPVNFVNPNQDYTANTTSNTISDFGKEMAVELKSLREEVAKLREEAAKNASMLVQSNFVANREAANTVSTSFMDIINQAAFNQTRNTGSGF